MEWYNSSEMAAGKIKRIEGEEIHTAWNAASQAVQSEIINICVSTHGDYVYWIAVPSRALANANEGYYSQFASVLPGGPNFTGKPAIYIAPCNDKPQLSIAMVWNEKHEIELTAGQQAKLESSMKRMNNGLPVIYLNEKKDLEPVDWIKLALKEEKLIKKSAAYMIITNLLIAGACILGSIIIGSSSLLISVNVEKKTAENTEKAQNLIRTANEYSQETVQPFLFQMLNLEKEIRILGGWLRKYQISGNGQMVWEAVLPANVTSSSIENIGGKLREKLEDGNVVVTN